jgi:hypothetical protein
MAMTAEVIENERTAMS